MFLNNQKARRIRSSQKTTARINHRQLLILFRTLSHRYLDRKLPYMLIVFTPLISCMHKTDHTWELTEKSHTTRPIWMSESDFDQRQLSPLCCIDKGCVRASRNSVFKNSLGRYSSVSCVMNLKLGARHLELRELSFGKKHFTGWALNSQTREPVCRFYWEKLSHLNSKSNIFSVWTQCQRSNDE